MSASASANGKQMVDDDLPVLTRKDFTSDQEVRWCPGCGDYAILAQLQKTLPELRIRPEDIAVISGIGCSSRLPYYVETYGFHSIHGRAPTIATGLKTARPELKVFVITGDGDGLSIGGNHLLHVMRRNVDLTIVLFNNRIYGLTKGQYSPTSEMGKVTKSSPFGTTEAPLRPIDIALAAGATYVARTIDRDTKHLERTLFEAAQHKGCSFVEVLQNCNVFNDGAFAAFTEKDVRQDRMIYLEDGEPLRFGKEHQHGIRLNGLELEVVEDAANDDELLRHNASADRPTLANLLATMDYPDYPVPVGVFRQIERPTYDELISEQVEAAQAKSPPDLKSIVYGRETWEVG